MPKIKQRIRWTKLRSAFALGLGARALRDRPGLRILIYHGVLPEPMQRIHARFVTTTQLDAHLAWIKAHLQVISLDQAFSGDYDPKRMAVAVTFDDGYQNNLDFALPLLQKYQVPATFFVTATQVLDQDMLWADALDIAAATSDQPIRILDVEFGKNRNREYADSQGKRLKEYCKEGGPAWIQAVVSALRDNGFRKDARWDSYWKLMSPEALRTMSNARGISIGGHGSMHCNLDRVPLADAVRDVQLGLDWIQKSTEKSVRAFAYPDGAYTPALVDALAQLGLAQQLLVEYRHNDQADSRVLDRFSIHPFLPTKVLMAEILRGSYF